MLLTSVVVNSIADTTNAPGTGIFSLRDAVALANSSSTPTTITFDPTVFASAKTITLNGTALELSNTAEPTTITGPAAGVTISGVLQWTAFNIDAKVTATLTGLTVTDTVPNEPPNGPKASLIMVL